MYLEEAIPIVVGISIAIKYYRNRIIIQSIFFLGKTVSDIICFHLSVIINYVALGKESDHSEDG